MNSSHACLMLNGRIIVGSHSWWTLSATEIYLITMLAMNPNPSLKPKPARKWNFRLLFAAMTRRDRVAPTVVAEPLPMVARDARRILVVEDDPVVRKATEIRLRAHGYAVSTAEDGTTAIQAVRAEEPDLILLDLGLPTEVPVAWDGFGVMAWLQRLGTKTPVIIFTGSGDSDLPGRACAAGAAGFCHKPLNYPALLAKIDAQLKPTRAEATPVAAPFFEIKPPH